MTAKQAIAYANKNDVNSLGKAHYEHMIGKVIGSRKDRDFRDFKAR